MGRGGAGRGETELGTRVGVETRAAGTQVAPEPSEPRAREKGAWNPEMVTASSLGLLPTLPALSLKGTLTVPPES